MVIESSKATNIAFTTFSTLSKIFKLKLQGRQKYTLKDFKNVKNDFFFFFHPEHFMFSLSGKIDW